MKTILNSERFGLNRITSTSSFVFPGSRQNHFVTKFLKSGRNFHKLPVSLFLFHFFSKDALYQISFINPQLPQFLRAASLFYRVKIPDINVSHVFLHEIGISIFRNFCVFIDSFLVACKIDNRTSYGYCSTELFHR